MSNKMLIIGGTGTIGQSLVSLLVKGKVDFRVMTRSQEKAAPLQEAGIETVKCSLENQSDIASALKNVDTVFLLTGPSPEQVTLQNGLIDQAKTSGVRKIVKLSALGAAPGSPVNLANWHGQTEDHLKQSGLEFVILQPHSFMQNILMSLGTIKAQGAFYQSAGDSRIPLVDTRDIAKASYQCLTSDDFNGHTYVITGGEAISFDDMAQALSTATGRNIQHVPIPAEAHNQAMKQAGLPDWLADDLTAMSGMWAKTPVQEPSSDFEKITGIRQIDLQTFANDYAEYFR